MRISSVTCSLPFINTCKTQTKCSILMKTAAIATGVFLLLIGFLVLYQSGTIGGCSLIALGGASVLAGAFLKCYEKGPKWITKRHAIYDQSTEESNCPIQDDSIQDTSAFADLPLEIFHLMLNNLDVSDLLKLGMTSKGLNQKTENYISQRFPVKSTILANHGCTAIKMKAIKDAEVKTLILELCGQDEAGELVDEENELSYERLKEILEILKEKNLLHLLNTIPVDRSLKYPDYGDTVLYVVSPLQHWAFKGKLDFVKLLVEHGAMDYLANSPFGNRSALYRAAECGHIEVVNYLLENGANADICFEGDILRSFIPDHIFHLSKMDGIELLSPYFMCLKRILDYMALYQPNKLCFQLTIPVKEGENIIQWAKGKNYPYLQQVYRTLQSCSTEEVLPVPSGSQCLDDPERGSIMILNPLAMQTIIWPIKCNGLDS